MALFKVRGEVEAKVDVPQWFSRLLEKIGVRYSFTYSDWYMAYIGIKYRPFLELLPARTDGKSDFQLIKELQGEQARELYLHQLHKKKSTGRAMELTQKSMEVWTQCDVAKPEKDVIETLKHLVHMEPTNNAHKLIDFEERIPKWFELFGRELTLDNLTRKWRLWREAMINTAFPSIRRFVENVFGLLATQDDAINLGRFLQSAPDDTNWEHWWTKHSALALTQKAVRQGFPRKRLEFALAFQTEKELRQLSANYSSEKTNAKFRLNEICSVFFEKIGAKQHAVLTSVQLFAASTLYIGTASEVAPPGFAKIVENVMSLLYWAKQNRYFLAEEQLALPSAHPTRTQWLWRTWRKCTESPDLWGMSYQRPDWCLMFMTELGFREALGTAKNPIAKLIPEALSIDEYGTAAQAKGWNKRSIESLLKKLLAWDSADRWTPREALLESQWLKDVVDYNESIDSVAIKTV